MRITQGVVGPSVRTEAITSWWLATDIGADVNPVGFCVIRNAIHDGSETGRVFLRKRPDCGLCVFLAEPMT